MPVSVFLHISVQSVVIFIYSRNTNTVSNSDITITLLSQKKLRYNNYVSN